MLNALIDKNALYDGQLFDKNALYELNDWILHSTITAPTHCPHPNHSISTQINRREIVTTQQLSRWNCDEEQLTNCIISSLRFVGSSLKYRQVKNSQPTVAQIIQLDQHLSAKQHKLSATQPIKQEGLNLGLCRNCREAARNLFVCGHDKY